MRVAVGIFFLLVLKETLGLEDGWAMNVTSCIYGIAWDEDYANSSTIKFKIAKHHICGQMDDIFRREPVAGNEIKDRYLTCHIDNFRQSNLHLDAPVSFSYYLVFNGSAPVSKSLIDALLLANTDTFPIQAKIWLLIGDTWLINRNSVDLMRINVPDFISTIEDKKQENDTVMQLNVEVYNFTWTFKSSQPAALDYQNMTSQFCGALDGLLHGRIQSYKGCNVSSILNQVDESTVLESELIFGRDMDSISLLLISTIAENSPRQYIDGKVYYVVGPVVVLKESLTLTSRSNKDGAVCSQKANDVLPDANSISDYIICHSGKAYRFTCGPTMKIDDTKKKCVRILNNTFTG